MQKVSDCKANLILLVFSVLFSLLVCEAALHIVNPDKSKPLQKPKSDWALVPERVWTEHHPVLGWAHQTNKTVTQHLVNGENVEIHTNSKGFRGTREYAEIKPEGTQRILALGDSFTFGWGVPDDQTFESRLEQKNSQLEVPNFGVAGYGIDQILLTYKEIAKKYQSDVVLISIFPEDFWRATRAFSDTGHAKPYFSLSKSGKLILHNVPVPPQFSLNINQFPDIIEPNPVENILFHSRLYRLAKKGFTRLGKNFKLLDPDSTDEWILGRKIVRELISEVEASGAHPVIVIVPVERWALNKKNESLHTSLIRLIEREHADSIDLTPAFRAAVSKSQASDYYIPGDGHWTSKGHQLAADLIAEHLSKHDRIHFN